MKLTRVRVHNFKSIADTGWVPIEQVTCLVGKNESGKTAFLQALERLKPVPGGPAEYDHELEYPRKDLNAYKRRHEDDPAVVVEAEYELNDDDVAAVESEFGAGSLAGRTIVLKKTYANHTGWTLPYDEAAIVRNLVHDAELPADTAKQLSGLDSTFRLRTKLSELGAEPPQAATLLERMTKWRSGRIGNAIVDILDERIPRFFYFDDYSIMDGRISVPALRRRRDSEELDEADRTFLALLDLVGAELEEFETQDNRERLIAALEAAGNSISDELFEFWSQNKELAVYFDLAGPDSAAGAPFNEGTNLQIRIRNNRHRVTVPFDQRSRGFVWFFSFLAYFSELERERKEDLILLLDEPGLNLHATAQADFLRFIEERLAPEHQVIYSTHSPFMVDARRLQQVRTVVDRDNVGTVVSDEIFRADSETVFPLQAALGYDVAQTLFVAPDNLLVEGASDLTYLQVFSAACEATNRAHLDPRWVIVPVGGVDKIASFLSLLGGQGLNTSVLIDVSGRDQQRIKNLQDNGHLGKHALVQVSEFVTGAAADIEDLMDPSFYLRLVNGAYPALPKKLTQTDLGKGDPRIAPRIQAYFDKHGLGRFSHLRPATYLLREQAKLIDKIPEKTLDRAAALFERVNRNLS
jgi:predicted ATP-dependent endonuclease of OLD family